MINQAINGWEELFQKESQKGYFKNLQSFIEREYAEHSILPEKDKIFRAYNLLRPEEVKVVILGQDPYPTKGHANGLSFSLDAHVCPLSKSLRNIYTELIHDVGVTRMNGDLEDWARQGVFLLNTVLTVREGNADSHKNMGWEEFTNATIEYLRNYSNIVFVLWGAKAQKKSSLIDHDQNLVISSPHPSPLSAYRGFFDSKPFSKINEYLNENNKEIIDW